MIQLPQTPESANVRALASWTQERVTGKTTASYALSHPAVSGTVSVFKNGSLVDPNTVTVSGATVTLGSALIAGDVVVTTYYARQGS